jgi:hypothetical protein
LRRVAKLQAMKLIRIYQSHLASRATGLSRLGWYAASAKEGAPWALGIAAATVLASLVPSPDRLLVICVAFIPGFIGWAASQIYMGMVHMRDLRSRRGIRD